MRVAVSDLRDATGHQEREQNQEPEGLQECLQGLCEGHAAHEDVIPQVLDDKQLDRNDDRDRKKTG